uniref:Calcium release activated channel regulator 2A n=1 Tax=Cyclopterus lumpus TaxID=8103 RepID=A0A8C3A4U6_CYCLU
MAAFTAPCASTTTTTTAAARAARQRQGDSGEAGKRENGDVGQNTIVEKTHEFFQMCDIESKGFITQRDMQRLTAELPLSAEELENVFNTLDSDGNGYLTLDEFSSGFSEFLFGRKISVAEGMGEKNACKSPAEVLYQTQWEESMARRDEDEEEKHFGMLMESLGANSVFEDRAEVRSLWAQLSRDEPHLLSNFEDFLARVTSQIIEANKEKREMESALQRKAATHDHEIQRLYVEMEQQIKHEKDRIVLQDHERFLSRSQDMELQLSGKEKELEQLFQKQKRLELQCQELHSEQHVTKVENVKLKHKNDELARELDHTGQELFLAQDQLTLLQEQSMRLHEEKEIVTHVFCRHHQVARPCDVSISTVACAIMSLSICSEDEEELITSSARHRLTNGSCQSSCTENTRGHLQRIISIEEDHLPHLLQNDCRPRTPLQECSEEEEASDNEEYTDLVMSDIYPCTSSAQRQKSQDDVEKRETPSSPRAQPVGKENSLNGEGGPTPPDRLFKIVLVGNSSVGKTSLLRRFCDGCFHPGTSATVGIDYSVKTIAVDNSQVALQLWDTAGQERYRSITKQFFRKADGVVVMYDITTVQSFTAVRQWLTSVKEGAGEDIPTLLLGNKTDKEIERQVQKGVGERLAKDCQMTFYECSACSGHNVMESMIHLARILKEQEDREKEKTVQLVGGPSEKKRSCC